jgi:hypothetical protein
MSLNGVTVGTLVTQPSQMPNASQKKDLLVNTNLV